MFFGTNNNPITSPTPLDLSIVSPITNNDIKIGATEQIKIKFSTPVAKESLKLELIPANEIELNFDNTNTELTVNPKDAWAFDTTYFIKISKDVKSIEGASLNEDYTYSFKTYPYSGIWWEN